MSTLITHPPRITAISFPGLPAGQTLHNISLKEIVGMLPVSAILHGKSKGTLFGFVSFRGKRVPVIDLRLGTTFPPLPGEEQICILAGETRQRTAILLGALVDSEIAAYELVFSTTH